MKLTICPQEKAALHALVSGGPFREVIKHVTTIQAWGVMCCDGAYDFLSFFFWSFWGTLGDITSEIFSEKVVLETEVSEY